MFLDRDWVVYMHINKINNKKYVGMTCNINSRFGKNGSGYLRKNKDGTYTQPAFANAIIKYGWENFSHEVLYSNLLKEEADKLEEEIIEKYNTRNPKNGYNIREGGSNGHLSEETKAKLREKMTGRYDGEDNPFYGKHHSQEVKNIISEKAKERDIDIFGEKNPMFGRIFTEEEKYIRGNANRGKHLSENTKEKISKSNKEYYKTHIHHALGVHRTEEQKEVLRQKMLGRKLDEECKEKIGKGHSKYIYVCVETNREYYSSGEAMRDTGIDKASIRRVANGQQAQAGGHHWIKKNK